jgi:hypothetical protein
MHQRGVVGPQGPKPKILTSCHLGGTTSLISRFVVLTAYRAPEASVLRCYAVQPRR